jgi:hypothetical protein
VEEKNWQEKNAVSSSKKQRFEILVRLAGFEPTTLWFVARYSIQLSYSRKLFSALFNKIV